MISKPTWRDAAYLVTGLPLAAVASMAYVIAVLPWIALAQRAMRNDYIGSALPFAGAVTALAVLAVGPPASMLLAAIERRRLRIIDDRPALRGTTLEARLWRPFAYGIILAVLGPLMYGLLGFALFLSLVFISAPFLVAQGDAISLGTEQIVAAREAIPYAVGGLVILAVLPFAAAILAKGHAAIARALLHTEPDSQLKADLVEVSRSRARMADAFEAERRRIERDLHDGAQQRLISLTLQLGLARLDLPADSPAAKAVADAHDQAKQLMVELRELIHGIHPQTVADAGLVAALRELADQSPIHMTVRDDLPERPAEPLEVTAYFAATEALNNIVKHSGASVVDMLVRKESGTLIVEIHDDGRGGADPAKGSGLTGIADRVAVIGGRMLLASPAGGPTVLRVELPWRSA